MIKYFLLSPIDGTQIGTTTPPLSEAESKGNEEPRHIIQSSRIGASSLHIFGGVLLFWRDTIYNLSQMGLIYIYIYIYIVTALVVTKSLLGFVANQGGARGVMVIVVGNGHRQHEFKSWTRLIAFHIAQIPLGKV